MKLIVNNAHVKIERDRNSKPLKRIVAGLLSIPMAINLYSGFFTMKASAQEDSTSYSQSVENQVDIPEQFLHNVSWAVHKDIGEPITKDDLKKIEELQLLGAIKKPNDYHFLQFCTGLKTLKIYYDGQYIEGFPSIPSLETLIIDSINCNPLDLTTCSMDFLDANPSLKNVSFANSILPHGCEEHLNKIESLGIYGNVTNCDLDFKKLGNIRKLILKVAPYDLAIFLNSEEYEQLLSDGVEIVFESEEQKNTYLKVNRYLDNIVASLEVNKNSTDKEKLDAILIYVLEHLQYAEELKKTYIGGIPWELTAQYGDGGDLYGVFETESSICINYAALLEALMDRLSIPNMSEILYSDEHAWNLVIIDGEPYYVDATWLDADYDNKYPHDKNKAPSQIEITNISETAKKFIHSGAKWYMENPNPEYIETIDENNAHIPRQIPKYMPTENRKNDKIETETETYYNESSSNTTTIYISNGTQKVDISNEQVEIKVKGKKFLIPIGVLVGILIALGLAIPMVKKQQRDKTRQFKKMLEENPDNLDDYLYGGKKR